MPCINILAHLCSQVQGSCCSSQQRWTSVADPAIWLSALCLLMDGAHPLWPTEFYLRLTSRCCRPFSTHDTALVSRPIRLLHLGLPALSRLHLSLSLSLCPHMPPISFSAADAASSGRPPSSLWHGRCLHQTDKQGGDKTPARIHMHVQTHTHLFTASKAWIVS